MHHALQSFGVIIQASLPSAVCQALPDCFWYLVCELLLSKNALFCLIQVNAHCSVDHVIITSCNVSLQAIRCAECSWVWHAHVSLHFIGISMAWQYFLLTTVTVYQSLLHGHTNSLFADCHFQFFNSLMKICNCCSALIVACNLLSQEHCGRSLPC